MVMYFKYIYRGGLFAVVEEHKRRRPGVTLGNVLEPCPTRECPKARLGDAGGRLKLENECPTCLVVCVAHAMGVSLGLSLGVTLWV